LPTELLPPVIAREDELKEVLVNLLENAREAVNGSGDIVVSAGPATIAMTTGGAGAGESWVSVAVTDTGVGISEDQLPRIFEPHFSTRSSGTGLGLAIVRRIADSWGAEIRADSEVGRGTRIELLLRAANGAGHNEDGE
jgi:signal transduction histidine kinase